MKHIKTLTLLFIFFLFSLYATAQKAESGYITTSNNARIYYEIYGKGEPILLLHGHSLDTRMWNSQIKSFSKRHQVIRFDFRGYGKSSQETEDYQFTHLDDLITVMDSLHISQAHIVGLSMGAFVASEMLAINPERMLSCVLASGSLKTYKGPSEPMTAQEIEKRDAEISELKAKGVDNMKKEWLENLIASGGTNKEKMRKPLKKMIDNWTAWQPLHKEVRVLMAHDAEVTFRNRKPKVPTLMIEGESPKNRHSKHQWMLDYLPNGEYYLLPNCGHMMNMEQPKAFNKKVMSFINKNSKIK